MKIRSLTIAMLVLPALLSADSFVQTNLVSPTPGEAAVTDPNLVNPWGFAYTATSPFWISNQGTGTSTLYDGAGHANSLIVSIPGGGGSVAGPTGQVAAGARALRWPMAAAPASFSTHCKAPSPAGTARPAPRPSRK